MQQNSNIGSSEPRGASFSLMNTTEVDQNEPARSWVDTTGMDGFRFNLASVLSRAIRGVLNMPEASLISGMNLLARFGKPSRDQEGWTCKAILNIMTTASFPATARLRNMRKYLS